MIRVRQHPNLYERQEGAALLISLVLLIVLTLLGVSAMQGTLLQERMAGNYRESQAALSAAEAALREGESYLEQASIGPFDGTAGLYTPDACNDGGSPAIQMPCWESPTTGWQTVNTGNWEVDPQFIIEELAAEPDPQGSLAADEPLPETRYYRVTARGFSENGLTEAMLQSYFRRQ